MGCGPGMALPSISRHKTGWGKGGEGIDGKGIYFNSVAFVPSSACLVPQEAKRRGPSAHSLRHLGQAAAGAATLPLHCSPGRQPGLLSPTEAWTHPFRVTVARPQPPPANSELPPWNDSS